jgi:DNA polymerase
MREYAKTLWGVDLTLDEAQMMVNSYRLNHNKVRVTWYDFHKAMVSAIQMEGKVFNTHKCSFKVDVDRNGTKWLLLTLPSGRTMFYNKPFLEEGKWGPVPCHYGLDSITKQWLPRHVTPGRITENIVQAAARDVLTYGMQQLEKEQFKIIWSIYDEVVCEESLTTDKEARLELMCKLMCKTDDWAKDLPLKAEGFICNRYKKG